MLVTYLCLTYAGKLSEKLGAMGIDAITRIVGFFVSAMGIALIFDGHRGIGNPRRRGSALIAWNTFLELAHIAAAACPRAPDIHN